jgi:hypothetical protein
MVTIVVPPVDNRMVRRAKRMRGVDFQTPTLFRGPIRHHCCRHILRIIRLDVTP